MSNTVASDECDEIGSVDDIETDYEDSDDLDAPVKQEHFDDANAGPVFIRSASGSTPAARVKTEPREIIDVDAFPTPEQLLAHWHLQVLAEFGLDRLPAVHLPPEVPVATFPRKRISKVLGGNLQAAYVLAKRDTLEHVFPTREQSPFLPVRPGEHGLFFTLGWRVAGGAECVVRIFARDPGSDEAVWVYLGDYIAKVVRDLKPEEWRLQPDKVKQARAKSLNKRQYLAASTLKRNVRDWKRLKREDGAASQPAVTAQDIRAALDAGQECMQIVALQCVGYDADVQRRLANGSAPSTSDVVKRKPAPRGQQRESEETSTSDVDSSNDVPGDAPSTSDVDEHEPVPRRSKRKRVETSTSDLDNSDDSAAPSSRRRHPVRQAAPGRRYGE